MHFANVDELSVPYVTADWLCLWQRDMW